MTKPRIPSPIKNFILHLHPTKIDSRAIKFNRTFGLGGISALLFLILCLSGLILRFSYVPTMKGAYLSIVTLQNKTIFGQLLRNLHHLCAHFLMITSFLHLVRVYYSQSIFHKRAKNWTYGIIMMLLVIFSNFTGYLLPLDQLAYWAVTVITETIEYIPFIGSPLANILRGGDTINEKTILTFYSLHTGILPILFIAFMGIHFWLIRKSGGIALPKQDKTKKINVFPTLVWTEVMTASIIIAVLFILSSFFKMPILEQANPLKSPNPSKAPWYFLGFQELLLNLHPIFSIIVIPLCIGGYFFSLPYFKYSNLNIGIWFNSPFGKKITLLSAIFSFIFTFTLIYSLEHYLHFDSWFPKWSPWISGGLIPFLLYIIPSATFIFYNKIRYKASATELFMATTTILLTSYIIMLLTSLILREKGMLMII